MPKLKRITRPYVLLCGGKHDSEFFSHLIAQHALPRFEICSVNFVLDQSHGGNSRIGEALDALVAVPGFPQVQRVLVVADNDFPTSGGNPPGNAFDNVVAQIRSTAPIIGPPAGRFEAPAAPLQKAGANPVVVILMLPWPGTPGNLDTMCLMAARNQQPKVADCVDRFASCTGANGWTSASALTKMKLRCQLAGSWKKDPTISPAYVWSEQANLVPLDDPIFDQVVSFLRAFPDL